MYVYFFAQYSNIKWPENDSREENMEKFMPKMSHYLSVVWCTQHEVTLPLPKEIDLDINIIVTNFKVNKQTN